MNNIEKLNNIPIIAINDQLNKSSDNLKTAHGSAVFYYFKGDD